MIELPQRSGTKPTTTDTNPHRQLDQNPPAQTYELLKSKAFDFPLIERRPSIMSVFGSEALWLTERPDHSCSEAFIAGNEFAHVHPPSDGSMHMTLPLEQVSELFKKGWGEQHPVALLGHAPMTAVMVFGPRDIDEIAIALQLLDISRQFANGDPPRP